MRFVIIRQKRKYDLKRHQNALHNLINKENKNCKNLNLDDKNLNLDKKCNKCSKIFSSKSYLQKHLLICKGVSNPLECHLCHKLFSC